MSDVADSIGPSPHDYVKNILRNAVQRTLREAIATDDISREKYLESVRFSWLRSLREAFAEHYHVESNTGRIAIFGGKPREQEDRRNGVPTGIIEWRPRWEFQCDVSVLEVTRFPAAYNDRAVPLVTKAIWLVESEIAGDGTQVAEDVSKLRVGRSQNILLIAAQTTQKDPIKWLTFLGVLLSDIEGCAYIALLPSYAAGSPGSQFWIQGHVEVELYCCRAGNPMPERVV